MPATRIMTEPQDSEQRTQELLEKVDWAAVDTAIEAWGLREYDKLQVEDNLVAALTRFLPVDFADGVEILSVETEKIVGGMKGLTDIMAVRYHDSVRIIDWKTTAEVNFKWAGVHRMSWQGPWYASLWEAEADELGLPLWCEFRGIERKDSKIRVVDFEVPKSKIGEVRRNSQYVWAMRSFDVRTPMRFGGYGCYSFGKACPYRKTRCLDDTDVPTEAEAVLLEESPVSPTSAVRIRECPRKNTLYQLDKLREIEDTKEERNDKAVYGNAFHSGIAEVYEQLIKITKGTE